jgi:hypothetical protein
VIRASLSIEHPRLVTSARIKKILLGSLLKSSVAKLVFAVSGKNLVKVVTLVLKLWPTRHRNTTISDLLKTFMNTSAHFFKSVRETQLSR